MFTEAPKPTEEQIREIEYLKSKAAAQRQAAEDSFQRCDTDGFLSQWASNIGAQKDEKTIKILEHGGCAEFAVLCDAEGNVVANKIYKFADKFRPDYWNAPMQEKWRLPDELAAKVGKKWIPVGWKSKVQARLGFHQEMRWFPAVAKITTGGRKATGLSGCANAFVAVFKIGEEE